MPTGPGELGHQQADRAGTQHQHPVAGTERGRLQRPPGVATWFDHRPGGVVDGVREPQECADGDASCSASAPGKAPRIPSSQRVVADVVPSGRAAAAVPAAQHRVAGDPPSDPGPVDAGAHRRHRAAPLVPEPHRVSGVALVQVCHLAGEELDVGAADTRPGRRRRPLGPGAGRGGVDLLHLSPAPGRSPRKLSPPLPAFSRRIGRGRPPRQRSGAAGADVGEEQPSGVRELGQLLSVRSSRAVVISSRSSSGPTKATLEVCGAATGDGGELLGRWWCSSGPHRPPRSRSTGCRPHRGTSRPANHRLQQQLARSPTSPVVES